MHIGLSRKLACLTQHFASTFTIAITTGKCSYKYAWHYFFVIGNVAEQCSL